jgi:hypothetical protein
VIELERPRERADLVLGAQDDASCESALGAVLPPELLDSIFAYARPAAPRVLFKRVPVSLEWRTFARFQVEHDLLNLSREVIELERPRERADLVLGAQDDASCENRSRLGSLSDRRCSTCSSIAAVQT